MDRQAARSSKFLVLPRQHNLQQATDKAFAAVRGQLVEQLRWLGAQEEAGGWRLAVLNDRLYTDLRTAAVLTAAGQAVGPYWRILVLHYLAIASRPAALAPEITLAELPSGRGYVGVYNKRVIDRLCATAGREAQALQAGAAALGARAASGGDLAFDLDVFPRLPVRLIWYAPDEEFPPSATLLFPPNVESFFCLEDIVVLSERLVSRLAGRPF